MNTLLAFLVTLGILIVVHEFGHYLVARRNGVKVLRFSLGFGPVMARWRDRHDTEWTLCALPLGGFVKMLDEREVTAPTPPLGAAPQGGEVIPESELAQAFNRKSLSARSAIVAAGPIANFLLAIALLWVVYLQGVTHLRPVLDTPPAGSPAATAGIGAGEMVTAINGIAIDDWQGLAWRLLETRLDDANLTTEDNDGHLWQRRISATDLTAATKGEDPLQALGLRPGLPSLPAQIAQVVAGQPAAVAGIQADDRILAIEGQPVHDWQDMATQIRAHGNRPLVVVIARQGQERVLTLTPRIDPRDGIARIGVSPKIDPELLDRYRVTRRYGPLEALGESLQQTWNLSLFSLRMMGRMLLGEVSLSNLSGPVAIADIAGQSAAAGGVAYLNFLALISISLGVLNLLPIPMLDGGHLLYYLAEFLRGRPVSERIQELAQRVGIAFLLMLTALALYNDLYRLFTR
jgi:regulator of sigma E protease